MGQAQINVRTRACSRTSIARTKQAALTHNVRGKELSIPLTPSKQPEMASEHGSLWLIESQLVIPLNIAHHYEIYASLVFVHSI